jgi:hypothetical protein
MRMKNDIFYEPVDGDNYHRIVTSLENEIARLKGELLPAKPASPAERDKQQTIWLELDRISRYLAQIRDKAVDIVHLS